jgi:hypothetical protein
MSSFAGEGQETPRDALHRSVNQAHDISTNLGVAGPGLARAGLSYGWLLYRGCHRGGFGRQYAGSPSLFGRE